MASSSLSSSSSSCPPGNLGVMDSSEAFEGGSPFDMLNEYVMCHLFSFLSVKDIKNCRLVDSTWNQACLRTIPKITHVVRIPRKVDKITELINLISSSSQFPWTNFEMNAKGIYKDIEKKTLLSRLFAMIAPFATGIGIDKLKERAFTNVLTYPVLKHLRLNYGFLKNKYVNPDFGLAIVENAPNLDNMLDLRGLRITDHALDLLGTSNGRKITRLVMRSVIEDHHLVRLSQLDLQLNYLSLQIRSTQNRLFRIGPESIKIMLKGQRAHLKKLELSDTDEDQQTSGKYCGFSFGRVKFPRMDKLTELKISLFNADYSDICFYTLFPSLGKLVFGQFNTKRDGRSVLKFFLKRDMLPIETLEELNFNTDCLYPNLDFQLVLHAGKQFPNLRKIQIPNRKVFLDCVFLSMSNVKELWLLLSDDEDLNVNLTGLSKQTYVKGLRLKASQLRTWQENWEPPRCFRKITKLGLIAEKLGNGRRDVLQLTEIGCRFGLLKMEGLKNLELVGDCSHISAELLNELSSKFTVEMREA